MSSTLTVSGHCTRSARVIMMLNEWMKWVNIAECSLMGMSKDSHQEDRSKLSCAISDDQKQTHTNTDLYGLIVLMLIDGHCCCTKHSTINAVRGFATTERCNKRVPFSSITQGICIVFSVVNKFVGNNKIANNKWKRIKAKRPTATANWAVCKLTWLCLYRISFIIWLSNKENNFLICKYSVQWLVNSLKIKSWSMVIRKKSVCRQVHPKHEFCQFLLVIN